MSIKIPGEDKRFKLANSTDLFGNIYSTRNINFDSEGTLKLSEGSTAFKSEVDDTDFDTPVGFGAYGTGSGFLSTLDKTYLLDFTSQYSASKDLAASTPTGGVRSHAVWWQDAWYQTQNSSLVRATIFPVTWSASLATLTSSINHPLCVFKNRNTMLIGNGNTIMQIDSSHSTAGQSQLTLPVELEVTSIAYGNNYVAIGTKNKQTNNGSNNTNAFMFIWDGTSSSANVGLSVESTYVIAVSNYQESSFIALTGAGQLLKYNGSGFDVIANLPFYYEDIQLIDSFPNFKTRNGIIRTDGDIIYINMPNSLQSYGSDLIRYQPEFPGGIYCYDPNVGLYHRYSTSISLPKVATITAVDLATNILTSSGTPVTPTGTPVRYNGIATVIAPLVIGKLYYTIKITTSTFKLATTYTNALAGTAIDLTSGTEVFQYFNFYNTKDFGQFVSDIPGTVDIMGSTGNGKLFGNLIWGTELNDSTLTNLSFAYAGVTVPDLENRGYFTTPRIESQNILDTFNKIYLKFKPLVQDIDKIIIKYRTNKRTGLPIITPQSDTGSCTWTNTTTFTTTVDISQAIIGDEVELISGSGSGQTAHIVTSILSAGTYTVVLDEPIKYILASDKSYFIIDNWNKIKTIDNTNTEGYDETSINRTSKWIQFKVELRGVGVTIEELQLINKEHLKSV